MEVLEAIKNRRSIREFYSKDISRKRIVKIIEAGMRAPSSKNTQPWHFIVLKKKKKDKIAEIVEEETFRKELKAKHVNGIHLKPTHQETCILIRKAPALILAFNKAPYSSGEDKVLLKMDEEVLLDWNVEIEGVSAAVENMLLAICGMGLGGVWLADIDIARKRISSYLNCRYDLVAGIAFGYPKYVLPPRDIPKPDVEILQ